MKITDSSLVFALLVASVAAYAQQPASSPQTKPTPDPGMSAPAIPTDKSAQTPAKSATATSNPSASQKAPDRSDAYYHFQLGHMYEEMVAVTGRAEYASKAVE